MNLNKRYGLGMSIQRKNARRLVDPSMCCGVEVELERCRSIHGYGVETKEDGSLRNGGKEYCTPPSNGDLLLSSLLWICKNSQDADASHRGSVHVHLNAGEMSPVHLVTLLKVFALVEPIIFSSFCPSRKDNNNCVPYYNINIKRSTISNILLALKQTYLLNECFDAFIWDKYTSLNIAPLLNFGTVEFRMFPATKDYDTLVDYVNVAQAVAKVAHRLKDKSNSVIQRRALGMFINYCNKYLSGKANVVYTTEDKDVGIATFDSLIMGE